VTPSADPEPPGALVCPSCHAGSFGGEERFCPVCGTPLVLADGDGKPESRRRRELRERARKIKPQYTEGELVSVAHAGNQVEAELIQNMLLEEGIPSMTRRSMGFDVPDFMAAGPRDVLVPRSGAEAARDVLEPNRSGGAGDTREV
jgi:Putative prokaryotic signal transducing protein